MAGPEKEDPSHTRWLNPRTLNPNRAVQIQKSRQAIIGNEQ